MRCKQTSLPRGLTQLLVLFFVPLSLSFYWNTDMMDGEQWPAWDHKVPLRIGSKKMVSRVKEESRVLIIPWSSHSSLTLMPSSALHEKNCPIYTYVYLYMCVCVFYISCICISKSIWLIPSIFLPYPSAVSVTLHCFTFSFSCTHTTS